MLSTLTLFGKPSASSNRPDNTAVATQFSEPNPSFVQAYQAALSSAE